MESKFPNLRQLIRDDHKAGMTNREIARKYQIFESAVAFALANKPA